MKEIVKIKYTDFIKDTSDDYYMWLKNVAQKKYYRVPYIPNKDTINIESK